MRFFGNLAPGEIVFLSLIVVAVLVGLSLIIGGVAYLVHAQKTEPPRSQ